MNETMPDVQYMDNNYERFYLVPWPDYQKFVELDEEQQHVFSIFIGGRDFCIVDAEWVAE